LNPPRSQDRTTDLVETQPHLGHPVSAVVDEIEKRFDLERHLSVFEAGCGFGHAACAIAEKFPTATVHAVDDEPEVVSLARERAAQLGVGSRVEFAVSRLSLGYELPFTRCDVLLFLAAQQVFGDPANFKDWIARFLLPTGVALVDRTVAVLPGEELRQAERLEEFRLTLGPSVDRVNTEFRTLSLEASLRSADLLILHAADDDAKSDLMHAKRLVGDGTLAQSCSALFVARNPAR
jgi:SAM-dependent methyltransferase